MVLADGLRNNKVAVVTGAGRGIGRAVALRLAQEGIDIVVAELDPTTARSTAAEVGRLGVSSLAQVTDVADKRSVDAMLQAVMERFGRVDILVNNAAVIAPATVVEMSEEEWDRVLDVSLKGVFLCSQAIGRQMLRARSGCVINMSSISSQRGVHDRGNYVVAKAGVIALTRVLAIEWAASGVRVNAVAPAFVRTELFEWASERGYTDATAIARVTPLHRIAEPAEIANVVAFLASDAASYVTGETIFVDGGLMASAQWGTQV